MLASVFVCNRGTFETKACSLNYTGHVCLLLSIKEFKMYKTSGCTSFVSVNITAIQLQAWTGPKDSRSLMFPEFLDSRPVKVAKLSALHNGCLYSPGNNSGIHFCWRVSRPQDFSATGRIKSNEISRHHRKSNSRLSYL